jgi:hypothetical protein
MGAARSLLQPVNILSREQREADPAMDDWAAEEGYGRREDLAKVTKDKQDRSRTDLYYDPRTGQIYVVGKGERTSTIVDGIIPMPPNRGP